VPARREVLKDAMGNEWLTTYTYFVGNEPIASIHRVQLLTAIRSMYARTTAGVVAISVPGKKGCDSMISDVEDTFLRIVETYPRENFE
jgi:hypothetical protein